MTTAAEQAKTPPESAEFKFPDETPVLQEAPPEEDIEIEVVDDTPEEDRGHKPGVSRDVTDVTDDELAAYSGNVQKRIKELSFARHDERRAKEAALREREELERIAQAAIEENRRLKTYVHNGEQVYASTAKQAAQSKLEIAKKKYKEAHEAFDADALIAAQQELTQAQMELTAAENFRPTVQAPLQAPPAPVYQQPTEQAPDEQALRWQQRNQWFGRDRKKTAFALAAHQDLVESGVDPRSGEYYKRIDAELRQRFPEDFGETQQTDGNPAPRRKPATVVSPTARSSSARKVTLTQTQVNLAKKFGLTNEQYAAQVALLEKTNG